METFQFLTGKFKQQQPSMLATENAFGILKLSRFPVQKLYFCYSLKCNVIYSIQYILGFHTLYRYKNQLIHCKTMHSNIKGFIKYFVTKKYLPFHFGEKQSDTSLFVYMSKSCTKVSKRKSDIKYMYKLFFFASTVDTTSMFLSFLAFRESSSKTTSNLIWRDICSVARVNSNKRCQVTVVAYQQTNKQGENANMQYHRSLQQYLYNMHYCTNSMHW